MDTRLRILLDNHEKLISMISNKSLPIKEVLLNNVRDVKRFLEVASKKKQENKGK